MNKRVSFIFKSKNKPFRCHVMSLLPLPVENNLDGQKEAAKFKKLYSLSSFSCYSFKKSNLSFSFSFPYIHLGCKHQWFRGSPINFYTKICTLYEMKLVVRSTGINKGRWQWFRYPPRWTISSYLSVLRPMLSANKWYKSLLKVVEWGGRGVVYYFFHYHTVNIVYCSVLCFIFRRFCTCL